MLDSYHVNLQNLVRHLLNYINPVEFSEILLIQLSFAAILATQNIETLSKYKLLGHERSILEYIGQIENVQKYEYFNDNEFHSRSADTLKQLIG